VWARPTGDKPGVQLMWLKQGGTNVVMRKPSVNVTSGRGTSAVLAKFAAWAYAAREQDSRMHVELVR
jgi:hypothetical protein